MEHWALKWGASDTRTSHVQLCSHLDLPLTLLACSLPEAGHAERAGEEGAGVEGPHVVKHLHAVQEDAVYAFRHLRETLSQVLELLALSPVLLLQNIHVLTVNPDGEWRGSIENPLQLQKEEETMMEIRMSSKCKLNVSKHIYNDTRLNSFTFA